MIRAVSTSQEADLVRKAAEQVFIQAFPLMLTDGVRRAHPLASTQFHLLQDDDGAIAPGLARDDPCVVATSAWIDLTGEPVVLRLPHTGGRYTYLTLIDTAGEPFASIGSRTNEDAGTDLALVGPQWRGELPSGLTARRAPSNAVWAVSRLHAFSRLDLPEALAVARQECVAFFTPPAERQTALLPRLSLPAKSSIRQIADLDPADFFHRLDAVLDRAPLGSARNIRQAIGALLTELGGPPPTEAWSADFERALSLGLADGLAVVQAAAVEPCESGRLGWRIEASESAAPPLQRAARVYVGLGAPLQDDVLSFACDCDEAGRPISGGERYCMRFSADALPPVRAFWRLSVHPSAGEHAQSVGDRSDLILNPDGSLDLIIQHSPPEASEIFNWLAAPSGPFSLRLRLYWPRGAAVNGAWAPPPVERLGSSSRGWRPLQTGRTTIAPPRPPRRLTQPRLAWRMLP